MKYIRTKDEIYEVLEIYTYTKKKLGVIIESLGCKTENESELKTIFYGNVLKQADTIEELCDEFVVAADFYDKPNVLTKVNSLPIDIDLTNHTIYGAIWTDKGLIYVAKMNENGGMELL